MDLSAVFLVYGRGLFAVWLVFPLVTYCYDKKAFYQPNWQLHMGTIMLFYPLTLPLLVGMRLLR